MERKMRIEIKTKGQTKDKDVRALFILNEGMKISSERMRLANLNFIVSKYGLIVLPKH